jgi:hypothetical protein
MADTDIAHVQLPPQSKNRSTHPDHIPLQVDLGRAPGSPSHRKLCHPVAGSLCPNQNLGIPEPVFILHLIQQIKEWIPPECFESALVIV